MKNITIFDTSISTRNVGDEIIMQSVNNVVTEIFNDSQIFHIPTHNYLTLDSLKCLRESHHSIVGGTNLLSSNMPFYQQWKVLPHDLLFLRSNILLGVGWWQYQQKPNLYTKLMLKKLLAKGIHSVRDSFTQEMLANIGIENVINTSCPTMWGLSPDHCKKIPKQKSKSVIYTLTDYNKNATKDKDALQLLRNEYENVYLWLQGSKDYKYLVEENLGQYVDEIIPPQLSSFDNFLERGDIEYIGTRLHAGIRALQKGCRSLILAVDNRAKEKKKDYSIHVVEREDLTEISNNIHNSRETLLNIDFNKINDWKAQFNQT